MTDKGRSVQSDHKGSAAIYILLQNPLTNLTCTRVSLILRNARSSSGILRSNHDPLSQYCETTSMSGLLLICCNNSRP